MKAPKQVPKASATATNSGNPLQLDEHYCYKPEELAKKSNFSDDKIRRLFKDEPDVLVFRDPQTGKRDYSTLRIPGFVAIRVFRRHMNPAALLTR